MEKNKDKVREMESLTPREIETLFTRTVLKTSQLPNFSLLVDSKEAWKILRPELMNCYQVKETEIDELKVVLLKLKANQPFSIATATTQAEASVKALILAHHKIYMSGSALEMFRKKSKTKSGRFYTQREFGRKLGNYSQQAQCRFEKGQRPVPAQVAINALDLATSITKQPTSNFMN
jgi:hypothetical protein